MFSKAEVIFHDPNRVRIHLYNWPMRQGGSAYLRKDGSLSVYGIQEFNSKRHAVQVLKEFYPKARRLNKTANWDEYNLGK